MSLQELEAKITQLPPAELEEFSKWFDEFLAEASDRGIDAASAESPPLSQEWLDEIARRSREVDEGTAKLIPYEDVMRDIRRQLHG